MLVQFVVQFVHFLPRLVQGFPASRGNPVNAPLPAARNLQGRFQQSASLQPMQQRIQRSRSNAIAVVRKLVHHRQSKNRLMAGVHQHVNPYQSEEEFLLLL